MTLYKILYTGDCSDFRLSFEFATTEGNRLLLYNGPMTDLEEYPGIQDFVSIELDGPKAKARIDLGGGETTLIVDAAGSKNLDDGMWHTIEIIKEFKVNQDFFYFKLKLDCRI